MASIVISDLNPSDNYLCELTDEEMTYVVGGFPWLKLVSLVVAAVTFTIAVINGE